MAFCVQSSNFVFSAAACHRFLLAAGDPTRNHSKLHRASGRILTASWAKAARLWEAFPDAQALFDRGQGRGAALPYPEQRIARVDIRKPCPLAHLTPYPPWLVGALRGEGTP
jgi:hypothetical protein